MSPFSQQPHDPAAPLHLVIAFYYFLAAAGLDKWAVALGIGCCYAIIYLVESFSRRG